MFYVCCKHLADAGLKVAFIESATAGYLAYQFSLNPHSGEVLFGGLVCYDMRVKEKILHISKELIEKYSPESQEVTHILAQRGHQLFDVDIVVACTGLVKPGGSETAEKPVGTFFYAVYYNNQIHDFRYYAEGAPEEKLHKLLNQICRDLNQLTKTP